MFLLRELALLALLGAAGVDAGFYGAKSNPVTEVDAKNFGKVILGSENAAIVEFYAPWCGHCKNLKPAYEKAAASMSGLATVAAIDCDDEKNKRTCGEYGVQGFPTLKIFRPSAKKGKPIVEDYNGPRTAKGIADALAERIPNHVTKITDAKLDEFLKNGNETAKAILFTNKGTTGALWKSLAIEFKGEIAFAQVRDKETKVVEEFGVTEFPKIVLLPGGGEEGKVYEGKVGREGLLEFFKAAGKGKKSEEVKEEEVKEEVKEEKPAEEKEEAPRKTLQGLKGVSELQKACFDKKAKTCLVALVAIPDAGVEIDQTTVALVQTQFDAVSRVIERLERRGPPTIFNVFVTDGEDELGAALSKNLELTDNRPALVAVNRKGWFRKYDGQVGETEDVMTWLDAVIMGEAPKGKIPDVLFEEVVAAPAEPEPEAEVEVEEEATAEGPAEPVAEEIPAKESVKDEL